MTKVLLTGANGYIGKHITLELLNQGYEVRASVRSLDKSLEVRNAVFSHLLDLSNVDGRLTFVELDLERDAGWQDALRGIDVLVHSASPVPVDTPRDENDLIRPAVDGTLRALNAAKSCGVKRVILTSSMAAIYGCDLPLGADEYDETLWTDVTHPIGSIPYSKSKTLAEKAAWDFIKNQAPEIELTTINPVLVLGSPLDKGFGSSISLIERILNGRYPILPDLRFAIVDVKDVARIHVSAIKNETAKGQRIIATSETRSFIEIAKLLKSSYPKSRIRTTEAPIMLLKFIGLFVKSIATILPQIGKPIRINGTKASRILGVNFIPVDNTIKETAAYLIKNGFIKS
jgi:dihydroflavonol-4-reductase